MMVRSLQLLVFCSIVVTFNFVAPTVVSTPGELLSVVKEFEGFKQYRITRDTTIVLKTSSLDDVNIISEAIRALKYQLAEEKLNELVDKSKVSNIVHYIYAGSLADLEIILEFAKSLSNGETQFLVFNTLLDEIKSNGNSDPIQLIDLVETIQRELAKQRDETLKEKVKAVFDNAVDDIKVSATSILKIAMVTDKYKDNAEIENLASALYNFRTDVYSDVIIQVVDGVHGAVSVEKILDNISSHKYIQLVITGLIAIFNRFSFTESLNNADTFTLVSHFQRLQLRYKYSSLENAVKDEVNKVIEQLPTCARNLLFYTKVCLWNKARRQYIYADDISTKYDVNRRSIFAWYPGDLKAGAFWNVQKIGDDFYFENSEYKTEYLYAPGGAYHNDDSRYVFTWLPGNNTDTQSAWTVELDGEYCYLKSTFFDEYLFAPAVKHDDLNGFVFTWKSGNPNKGPDFQWQIRNC